MSSKLKILVVDDYPTMVRIMRKLLKQIGYEDVDEASNGKEAFDKICGKTYDLIISDMGRGSDMTAGYDLLARIRASGNRVPFLIFAGSDKPEFRAEAKRRGAQLSTNDMLELIDTVIKELARA